VAAGFPNHEVTEGTTMNRTYGKALIRIFALFSGLVVAVALSGCGGAGEVGTIEEETSSTSDDVPGREKANRDGVQEEPTSEEAPDAARTTPTRTPRRRRPTPTNSPTTAVVGNPTTQRARRAPPTPSRGRVS
jgi:hypothetical protein